MNSRNRDPIAEILTSSMSSAYTYWMEHVREEEELYSAFDPSGLTLSSSLTEYLEDYVEERKPGEAVCIDLRANAEINDGRFRKSYSRLLRKM